MFLKIRFKKKGRYNCLPTLLTKRGVVFGNRTVYEDSKGSAVMKKRITVAHQPSHAKPDEV